MPVSDTRVGQGQGKPTTEPAASTDQGDGRNLKEARWVLNSRLSVCQSLSLSVSQSVSLSVSQSLSLSVSQSLSHALATTLVRSSVHIATERGTPFTRVSRRTLLWGLLFLVRRCVRRTKGRVRRVGCGTLRRSGRRSSRCIVGFRRRLARVGSVDREGTRGGLQGSSSVA